MTYTTRENLHPRRQVGPDALKYLRDISKHITGDRFAFDGCRVQRNRTGMPAKEIDATALEEVGSKHPDSYGVFIKRFVIPEAEMLAHYLSGMTEEDRKARLSILLRKAHSRDATAWWLLSTASLRSMLFPGAYTDGRRSDNVIYLDRPKDYHRGKVVILDSLTPASVAHFTTYAFRMIGKQIDPSIITPLTY